MTSVSGLGSSANATALQLLQQASRVLSAKSQTPSEGATAPKLAYGSAALSTSAREAIMQIKTLAPGKVVSKSEVASEVYNAGAEMTPEEIRAYNANYIREFILPRTMTREEFEAGVIQDAKNMVEYGGVETNPKLSAALRAGTFRINYQSEVPELADLGFSTSRRPIYSGGGLIIGMEVNATGRDIDGIFAAGGSTDAGNNPYVITYW